MGGGRWAVGNIKVSLCVGNTLSDERSLGQRMGEEVSVARQLGPRFDVGGNAFLSPVGPTKVVELVANLVHQEHGSRTDPVATRRRRSTTR
jgi:hypothetical protein